MRDSITGSKGLRQEEVSFHILYVCILRLARQGKTFRIVEHRFHPLLPSNTSHVREEEVPANVCHIWFSPSRFLVAGLRDSGRRFFKQANRQGGVTQNFFSIADGTGTDFLGYGKYRRIDCSPKVVN